MGHGRATVAVMVTLALSVGRVVALRRGFFVA
jgi:hypothetical protein